MLPAASPCGNAAGGDRSAREPLDVGVYHHLDERLEVDGRRPSELRARLRRIAEQMIHFGRTQERRVDPNVFLPVEACMAERDLDELAHRVADAGGDDVIVG